MFKLSLFFAIFDKQFSDIRVIAQSVSWLYQFQKASECSFPPRKKFQTILLKTKYIKYIEECLKLICLAFMLDWYYFRWQRLSLSYLCHWLSHGIGWAITLLEIKIFKDNF